MDRVSTNGAHRRDTDVLGQRQVGQSTQTTSCQAADSPRTPNTPAGVRKPRVLADDLPRQPTTNQLNVLDTEEEAATTVPTAVVTCVRNCATDENPMARWGSMSTAVS